MNYRSWVFTTPWICQRYHPKSPDHYNKNILFGPFVCVFGPAVSFCFMTCPLRFHDQCHDRHHALADGLVFDGRNEGRRSFSAACKMGSFFFFFKPCLFVCLFSCLIWFMVAASYYVLMFYLTFFDSSMVILVQVYFSL